VLPEIDQALRRSGGVATRRRLLSVVSRHQLDREVRTGRLVSPFPRALCRPWDADFTLDRAALTSVGPPAALSHLTALKRWEVLEPQLIDAVHVSVPASRYPRGQAGLAVHRVARLPQTVRLDGLPTVQLADAIVTSWPMLGHRDQREPAISAVRRRLITPGQLRTALATAPRLAGRSELSRLIELLEAGCESELEIWGLLSVFDIPGLRHGVRQRWLRAQGSNYRLDLAYDAERVAVELDGSRFHSTRRQRERDMRRDAALASIDWLTLRYSRERLHDDAAGCRRDTLATLATRTG
jgi:very-short-patch-repair endonuclease